MMHVNVLNIIHTSLYCLKQGGLKGGGGLRAWPWSRGLAAMTTLTQP